MQAARFDIASHVVLHEITVIIGGDSVGARGRIRIFGNEWGLAGPALEHDLIPPITIGKERRGIERRTLKLPRNIVIEGTQFFVAFQSVDKGIALLSDTVVRRPVCALPLESYACQILKHRTGETRFGRYSFAITAVVEPTLPAHDPLYADLSEELGLAAGGYGNRSISWSDLDGDGFLDVMAGGKLYLNRNGKKFVDMTSQTAIAGTPRAHAFIDMDADGKLDILCFDDHVDTCGIHLYHNEGQIEFTRHCLGFSGVKDPTAFAMTDANLDGFIDLLVAGADDSGRFGASIHLLMNTRTSRFSDATSLLDSLIPRNATCRTAQWIDYDGDHRPDLLMGSPTGETMLLLSQSGDTGSVTFRRAESGGLPRQVTGADVVGGAAGGIDLVVSRIPAVASAEKGTEGLAVYTGLSEEKQGNDRQAEASVPFVYGQAGVAWGDADNDGDPDFFAATDSDCRYGLLYIDEGNRRFVDKTSRFGLGRIRAAHDAVWVDMNNDGRLDLSTFDGNRFRIYKNVMAAAGTGHTSIDLENGPRKTNAIGAEVTVYAGGRGDVQQVGAGRGILMQQPSRLHFGLGDERKVDSIVVRWPGDGERPERFTNLKGNGLIKLVRGKGTIVSTSAVAGVRAFPNPFSDRVTISYTLAVDGKISVDVYDLLGRHIVNLVDGFQGAGEHEATWQGESVSGEKSQNGTYIFKIRASGNEYSGQLTLRR